MKADISSTIDPNYGDRVSTVDARGKRKWIYALQPVGKLYTRRTIVSLCYLLLFFTIPFLKINGGPAFLFNVVEARFIFFGKLFLPQDFIILGTGMLAFLLFIIVFTLIFGRVFCGWACPQTIFLEMVFRRIEYWIEGNANKQKLADKKPGDIAYYLRKALKHIIFLLISFLIANTFLSYIIGVDQLFRIINEPITDHLAGFFGIVGFTLVFYAVFAFVRDLVCTVICPYGRLQSVLLDKNSIVVAYDYLRGEPRSKIKKGAEPKGDCIDCGLCVQVCPTGIDIRNGTQMECVNCTACIDACNMMMKKVNRMPDLIKYASENNIAKGEKPRFTYRLKAYTAVLIILVGSLTALLVTRSIFDATVLRVPGQILQENNDGTISNLYRIKIVNKSNVLKPYHLAIAEKEAALSFVGKPLEVLKPVTETEETFFIKVAKENITKRKSNFTVQVMSGNEIIQTKKVSFIGEY